ncbi:MAG: hypothetical protein V4550_01460 [Gemmatimonadota bacterium]
MRLVAMACLALGSRAERVGGQANSGALDLLFPMGARGTALGFATVAETGGESIWSNPAGLARLTKPEFAVDHFVLFPVESGLGASIVLPAGAVGVFGISARLFDYGSAEARDEFDEVLGITSTESRLIAGTFAAAFGDRLNAGIAFRLYNLGNPCSGLCPPKIVSVSSTNPYLDAGIQFRPSATSPFMFGAELSNIGPDFQLNDQPQSDAAPSRVHFGASYAPAAPSFDPLLHVRATGEVVMTPRRLFSTPDLSKTEIRAGVEATYVSANTTLALRGGYVKQSDEAAPGRGPSFGIGLSRERIHVDFTRIFERFSTDLGVVPTYISIRVGL